MVLFSFACEYDSELGLLGSIHKMYVPLTSKGCSEHKTFPIGTPMRKIREWVRKDTVSFKYPVTLGIVLIFTGIGFIVLSKPTHS